MDNLTPLEMEQENEWRQTARMLRHSIARYNRARTPASASQRYDVCMAWRRTGLQLIGYLESNATVDDPQDFLDSYPIWERK